VTHGEFVAAYARGELKIEIEPRSAARHLSARLLLPFVMMPVLGIGVALALIGRALLQTATDPGPLPTGLWQET